MGARVIVTRPQDIWFDEISFTNARLGEIDEINVFNRFDGFGDPNYRHLLVRKELPGSLAASADFTSHDGARTLRGAFTWEPAIATVHLEGYRRIRGSPDGGLSVSAERRLTDRFRATIGYTTIDPRYGNLNSDRFFSGQRVYVMTAWAVAPWLGVTTFYTKAFGNDFPVALDHRFDVVATYNVLDTLRRTGRF
jgi:hypothetical protein